VLWANRPPALAADALDLRTDGRVMAFTLLVSLATAVLFGLVPAWRASRPGLADELKQRGGPSLGGGRRFGLRNLLVAGQVAMSLVALIGAGLFVRSLQSAQRIDPGFDHDKVAVLTVDLGGQGYDEARSREFHRRMLETARALPGVEGATLATGIPLFQGSFLRTVFTEGVDTTDRRNGKLVQLNTVEPGYFDTMGIAVRRGRDLAESDTEAAPHVVLVNETMAQQFWPDQEAVGKRFKFFGQDWWNEVVGVTADGKYSLVGEEPTPQIYLSLRQVHESAVSLHVRAAGDPEAALGLARKAVQEMDRALPITNVLTYREILSQALWAPRMGAYLLGAFALLSLVLAVVGLYGVMSYSVSQRRREMGIRLALGAARPDVLRLVVGQGLGTAAAGIAVGLALSLALTRLVVNLLYGVSPYDPVAFVAVPLLLAAAAALACALPAWRAGAVDPTEALRSE
jgi:predicted permease